MRHHIDAHSEKVQAIHSFEDLNGASPLVQTQGAGGRTDSSARYGDFHLEISSDLAGAFRSAKFDPAIALAIAIALFPILIQSVAIRTAGFGPPLELCIQRPSYGEPLMVWEFWKR